jgi:cyclic pyranopterin phosphate synthase
MNQAFSPLLDSFGRLHQSLRISVTDACNIRCRYCMPEQVVGFLPQHRLLSFEHIARVVDALARSSIRKLRITGGEPLMRPRLPDLVSQLRLIPQIEKIALTTNGMMLADCANDLVNAGLTHINISLDTLSEETFRRLTRREGIDRVIAGIDAAVRTTASIRLNALVMRDINLEDCVPLVEFALNRGLVLRFIEFMPLDADRQWSRQQVVTGDELRERLGKRFGPMEPVERSDSSQPSTDYRFAGHAGTVGFIDPVSKPFCDQCDRLRLTADGKFRNCLFGKQEWDLRKICEENATLEQIVALARQSVQAKYASHGISDSQFKQPERAMYQIGG